MRAGRETHRATGTTRSPITCATITPLKRGADEVDKRAAVAFPRARMRAFFFVCAFSFLALAGVKAGEPEPVPTPELRNQPANPFAKGSKEFQDVLGGFRSFKTKDSDRPSIDYAIDSVRLGIMLNDPYDAGLLSGNFEVLGEVFGGAIVQGPGDVLTGATLVFRYNFVQPNARIIPYFQVGGGGVYTNVGEEESRGIISLPVEFNLQGTAGIRYMLNDRWSLVFEGGYRHISNAGIKLPNIGLDSVGGNVGFGFSF
jgi:lipid A 3-O-deacylase